MPHIRLRKIQTAEVSSLLYDFIMKFIKEDVYRDSCRISEVMEEITESHLHWRELVVLRETYGDLTILC